MTSKEEVLAKLGELFPDGIPDACGTVMAHADAPFKSYQELRRILKRSSAWGNRRKWKMLLSGTGGSTPQDTKKPVITLVEGPSLVADWTLTPSKGSASTAQVTVTAGKLQRSRLVATGPNAELVSISPESSGNGNHSVEIIGDNIGGNAVVDLNMYATDDKDGKEKFLGTKKLTITAGE